TLQQLAHTLAGERTVIVPDLPGFGRSQAPKQPEGWDTAAHAEWLAELMQKLKLERADLFGHSHGGRIASCLAATAPERVDRLVLCCRAGRHEPLCFGTRVK